MRHIQICWKILTGNVYINLFEQKVINQTNSFVQFFISRYILPVVNPDGYEFTQIEEDNRFWRKTRKPNSCPYNAQSGTMSGIGTDANRNFGYLWGTGGSSSDPCSGAFMGEAAFNNPETANIRDFLTAHKDKIKFFNTIHSYMQMILLPWSHTAEPAPNIEELTRVANVGNEALYAEFGKTYKVSFRNGTSLMKVYL